MMQTMLIGMTEAAERLGLSGHHAALALLRRNNVPLVTMSARFIAVEEADLEAFIQRRRGRGRPKKSEEGQE